MSGEKQVGKHLSCGGEWDLAWPGLYREFCWSVHVLRLVSNQSEIEGFLLLFPGETLFRKWILTILCCFCCYCISVITFQQPFCVELLKSKATFLDVLIAVICSHSTPLTPSSSKVLLVQQSAELRGSLPPLMFFRFSGEVCVRVEAVRSRKYYE